MKERERGVYTPQINSESAFLLRRIAWAAKKPMTVTLDNCIGSLVGQIDQKAVCLACKDKRCLGCPLMVQGETKKLALVK